MLKQKQTFKFGDVKFIVDPKKPSVVVQVENGQKATIKKIDLWGMVFAMSDSKQQEGLIPVQKSEIMQIDRVHTIKATKDIKEGETVKFHCHIDIPLALAEAQLTKVDIENSKTESVIHTPVAKEKIIV